jgi:uncharacterized protein with HEPN domain
MIDGAVYTKSFTRPFGVDLNSVFRTAKEDLPALKKEVMHLLDKNQ